METALLLLPGLFLLHSSAAEQSFIPHFLFWSTSNCQTFRPGLWALSAAPVYSSQDVTHHVAPVERICTGLTWAEVKMVFFAKLSSNIQTEAGDAA